MSAITTTRTVASAEFDFLDRKYQISETARTAEEAEAKLVKRLTDIREELDRVIRELQS